MLDIGPIADVRCNRHGRGGDQRSAANDACSGKFGLYGDRDEFDRHGRGRSSEHSRVDGCSAVWESLKEGDTNRERLVASDATMGVMGLGGGYDPTLMQQLAENCELVAMLRSKAQIADDPTGYAWGVLECIDGGETDTIPVGFRVKAG